MERCGNDSECIKNGIYATQNYAGIGGNYSFDANGDVVGIGYVLKKFEGGKIVELNTVTPD